MPGRRFQLAMPMTPQAGRGPALPVFLLSSFPPLPRSSVPAWTTMVLFVTPLVSLSFLIVVVALVLMDDGTKKGVGISTYSKNAVLANQFDLRVGDGALCIALAVGLDVAEVADVAVAVRGAAVLLAEGIDFETNGQ